MRHDLTVSMRTVTLARRLARPVGLLIFLGCGSDAVGPRPAPDPARLYWALTFDQHALTVSTAPPYDTARIAATPRDAGGAPLTGVPAVTYKSTDLQLVRVRADGMIQAVAPGQGIAVVATLTIGNLTHADTAVVNVTTVSPPPVLTTFSIHPVPPDSAIWDAGALGFFNILGSKQLQVRMLDAAGNPMPGLAVDFRSSDSTIAQVDRGTGALTGMRPGGVMITASATAFGVRKADTVPFTITMPVVNGVFIGGDTTIAFKPSQVTIAAGGTVVWGIFARTDVVFDDSTHVAADSLICPRLGGPCSGGNIAPFKIDSTNVFADLRFRHFPMPGTYTYHSTLVRASGAVIVTPAPARTAAAAVSALAASPLRLSDVVDAVRRATAAWPGRSCPPDAAGRLPSPRDFCGDVSGSAFAPTAESVVRWD